MSETQQSTQLLNAPQSRVDPLTLGVIWRGLVQIANDAGMILQQTAYSEAVREAKDFSVGLFDHQARMIAQGDFSPGHLGSMPNAVKHVLDYYPVESLEPGDAIMLNDSWMGSGHLPDFFLITPAFLDGRIVGYTVCTVHMIDIGGAVPGSQAVAGINDHYQEGIRFLPVRMWHRGEPNVELMRTLEANVRVPDKLVGDLKAMRNCNRIGGERLVELLQRFGPEVYEAACDEILERSAVAMRAAIAGIPDGTYRAVDHFDDFGPGTDPLRIEVAVTVSGDEITIDFEGTSPQTRSGLNGIESWAKAWCFFTVKVLTQSYELPQNAGCLEPLIWKAPPGCVLNTQRPAGSGARAAMQQRVVEVIMQAMAPPLPDRVLGASSHWGNPVVSGIDPRNGAPFVFYDIVIGGFGGMGHKDGLEAVSPAFNINTVPCEVNEESYPVLVERYELIRGSAGPGKHRGGHGIRQDVLLLGENMQLMNLTDRQKFPPPGVLGGKPGHVGATILNPGENEQVLHSKGHYDVSYGDLLSNCLAGGGGFGDPSERDPDLVARDVRDGFVSIEDAADTYGVVIDADGVVDAEATRTLRSR